jgi:hypothetical protein
MYYSNIAQSTKEVMERGRNLGMVSEHVCTQVDTQGVSLLEGEEKNEEIPKDRIGRVDSPGIHNIGLRTIGY